MIKQMALGATLLAVSTMAHANADSNVISLLSATNEEGNQLELNITGNSNSLILDQTTTLSGDAGNVMDITIWGDNNGGAISGHFTGIALNSGLQPGRLVQNGTNNRMQIQIQGSNNLFSALQTGHGNQLSADIQGFGNQAAIQQYGQNNHASISQSGNGNAIRISQRSF